MKLKTLVFLSLISIFVLSCDDEFIIEQDCVDRSQVQNAAWFQDYINGFSESTMGYWYMSVGTYNFQTVYLPGNCCPFCLTLPVVLDCSGKEIGILGNGEGDIDPAAIKDIEVIWRAPNFACTN